MRQFEYKESWKKLLTPNIVSLLTSIHEYKGEQNLFIESNSDKLAELLEIAKIQSTEASNKIEGIITTEDSKIPVYVLATDEELMIARDTYDVIEK